MTDLRSAAQQALEALEGGADSWQRVGPAIDALKAALAEPTVKESLQVESAFAENATTQQQLEEAPPSDYRRGYWNGFEIGKREGRIEAENALAEPVQAKSDHETRAEIAEQQVVQLAEERDHYRHLWQKAQQAEPQEPVRLQCTTCGTVYADGVPPQVPVQEAVEPLSEVDRRALYDRHAAYAAGAAAEREACAKLIELHGGDDRFGPAVTIERLVAAIRARGQQ